MKKRKLNYSLDEKPLVNLNYGEVYSLVIDEKEERVVYIGKDLKGMGRILMKVKDLQHGWKDPEPAVFGFNLRGAKLEGKVLAPGRLSSLSLSRKEYSFALEILNKKGL